MISLLRAAGRSLFLRLLLIFSATVALFILISILSTHQIMEGRRDESGSINYFERHIKEIISDIGTPPDLDRAATLAQELPISLLIIGPELHWQSDSRTIDIDHIRVVHSISDTVKIVRSKSTRALQVSTGDFQYYLFSKRHMLSKDDVVIIYFAVAATLLTLLLNYWLVRRLLKPIRLLKDGAERISQGELDYRVQHNRSDELGDLTNSINSMADSLQGMLAAKQQLLLAISHELRTPITRAKVQIEFIEDPGIKHSLKEDINELDLLVTELLEAERLNSQHASLMLEPLPFVDFITQILEQYWPQQPLIQWQPSQANQHNLVNLDRLRFSLLLRNLINNALRYGEQNPITVDVEFTAGKAQLTVTDKGRGISAEHIEHLTEPFYRADSARQRQTGGFGLGLYLCKLIAEAHGGSLTLKSELEKGTTVRVEIPFS